MAQPDVCIVGAGPAGLACAIAASRRGMRVRILEAEAAGPIDKACGEGLLPDAIACLEQMGVHQLPGYSLAGIRFHGAGRTATATFPGALGRGVRRTELHRALLTRAASLGVEIAWKTPLRSLDGVAGRFVVGADGNQSRVRTLAGFDGAVFTRRIGLRQHFALRPWSDFVEVFWSNEGQAYVTPVSDRLVGIAFLSRRRLGTVAQAMECFPALRARLPGATAASVARGGATVTRRLKRVTKARIALVGDASGSVDAITGEGINLAFRQAEALATAMVENNLAAYEEAHRRILRPARIMGAALLAMGESPAVRSAAMPLLDWAPGLFRGLLAWHVRGKPQSRAVPYAWRTHEHSVR